MTTRAMHASVASSAVVQDDGISRRVDQSIQHPFSITVKDPRGFFTSMLVLLLFVVAVGGYIVWAKPGIKTAAWRSIVVPNHPANPVIERSPIFLSPSTSQALAEEAR